MKRLTTGGLILLLLAGVAQVQASTVLIDFESYGDGTNLQGVNLGGVTLSNPSGKVEVFENRFGVSSHSGTKAVASAAGLTSVNPLSGVFDAAVSSFGLWGGDAGWDPDEMDSWELRAYDAPVGGNLVGRVSSGSWVGNPYRRLTLSAEEIWRFEAYWTGTQFGIGYDDLEFVFASSSSPEDTPTPSNGSFDGSVDTDVLTIDFGEIQLGASTSVESFDIWNLATSSLTADLDLSGFAGTGDTGTFFTNLTTFSGLAPNSSQGFSATIDSSTPGEFSATFSLAVSDATGQPQSPLTIAFSGVVVGEPIPEPSALGLAAVGLASVLAWGWRRRRAG